MPNRSIRNERDAEGNPIDEERHVAGPANDVVRKTALAARNSEREVDSRPAPLTEITPTPEPITTLPARNIRAAKQRRDDQLEAEGK